MGDASSGPAVRQDVGKAKFGTHAPLTTGRRRRFADPS